MAPRKMKQVEVAHDEQNMDDQKNINIKKVSTSVQFKRVKAKMGKLKDDQQRLTEEQIRMRKRYTEIERQCDELKEETKTVIKQTARTQIKLVLMFKILKARESGDFIEAATLTHLLRFVSIRIYNYDPMDLISYVIIIV